MRPPHLRRRCGAGGVDDPLSHCSEPIAKCSAEAAARSRRTLSARHGEVRSIERERRSLQPNLVLPALWHIHMDHHPAGIFVPHRIRVRHRQPRGDHAVISATDIPTRSVRLYAELDDLAAPRLEAHTHGVLVDRCEDELTVKRLYDRSSDRREGERSGEEDPGSDSEDHARPTCSGCATPHGSLCRHRPALPCPPLETTARDNRPGAKARASGGQSFGTRTSCSSSFVGAYLRRQAIGPPVVLLVPGAGCGRWCIAGPAAATIHTSPDSYPTASCPSTRSIASAEMFPRAAG